MKLRQLIPILFCISFLPMGCEEDDICIGEGTPHLTVVFRNIQNTSNQMDTLSIYRSADIGFENSDTIYEKIFTDSIKLPMGGLNDERVYFKIKRRSNVDQDILTIDYQSKSEYVSKACGFRLVYENLSYQITNYHINSIVPSESNELRDESITNLYIVLDN
ncbi:MAG: DUF6452 family protein [Weeksellaceae bacterium]|jgi:hypothetical protein|nr:DUF6452 family protein [Weeksellaceae bacterium]